MHPMFVTLFLQAGAEELVTGEQDGRRHARRARRCRRARSSGRPAAAGIARGGLTGDPGRAGGGDRRRG